jgi:RHS repeat-associated protein
MKLLILILMFAGQNIFAADGISIYSHATIPKNNPVFNQIQNAGVDKRFTIKQGDTGELMTFQITGETTWPNGQSVWIAEPVQKGPGLGSKTGAGRPPSNSGGGSGTSGGGTSGSGTGGGVPSGQVPGNGSMLGDALNAGATSALLSAGYQGLALVLVPSVKGPMEQYEIAIADLNNANLLYTNTVIGGVSAFRDAVGSAQNALGGSIIQLSDFKMVTPSIEGLVAPSPEGAKTVDQPICANGSIIRTDNSALGESVAIAGTPFRLVYFSDRVPGRKDDQTVVFQLTGASVIGLSEIELDILDGKEAIKKIFNPTANLSYRYEAVGLNSRIIKAKITYKRLDGSKSSRDDQFAMGHWSANFLGLGGWTISVVHHYDVETKRVHFGDGMSRNVNAIAYQGGWLVTNQAGTEAYVFEANGRHLRTVDALTNVTLYSFNYDASETLQSISDSHKNMTVIQHVSGSPTVIVGPFGQTTRLATDRFGWLSTITDPNGSTNQMTYSPTGLLQTFTKPNGRTSTMTYDSLGLLLKDLGPLGNLTELLRKQSGPSTEVTLSSALRRQTKINIVSNIYGSSQTMTSPEGLDTKIIDDPKGTSWMQNPNGLIRSSLNQPSSRFGLMSPVAAQFSAYVAGTNFRVSGQTTEFVTLNNSSDPLSLSQMERNIVTNEQSSHMEVNGRERSIKLITGEGRSHFLQFNDKNDLVMEQIGNLSPIRNAYDSQGHLVKTSQGSRVLSYHYNSRGNVDSITDAHEGTTTFRHDGIGRVVSRTDANGATTEFGYDELGNLIQIVTPKHATHQFEFSALGEPNSYIIPAQKNVLSYNYNLDRQLTEIHFPDGKMINFLYGESSGMLTGVRTSDASIGYEYMSQTGLPSKIHSSDGVTNHIQYDGPMIGAEEMTGEVHGSIRYSYENNFRLSSIATGAFPPVSIQYDGDGLLKVAGQEIIERDTSTGFVTGTRNGLLSESKTFDQLGNLSSDHYSFSGKMLFGTHLMRDKIGRIVSRSETLANGTSHRFDYRYDRGGRLRFVYKNGAATAEYLYDANGNRSRTTTDEQDRLLKTESAQYAYTDNGSLQAKKDMNGITHYAYDSFGNLKSVTTPTEKIDYLVDGKNRRVGKKINGVLKQGFLYQSQLQIAAEVDASGNVLKQFVYSAKPNVPDYMITRDGTYAIISDHLGSPRMIVDVSSGAIKQEIDYDEFGRVLRNTNPDFVPFGFAGGLSDQDTGLVHFGARDYDPEIGRWTSKDPILFGGGDTNLYGYVMNDPINFIDPVGLWSFSASLYLGYGGGISFGRNPDGGFFNTLRGGVGLGGEFGFDPNGTSPSYNSCSNPGRSIGGYAEASAHLGAFELGAGVNSGYSDSGGPYATPLTRPNINVGLVPSIGIGIGGGAGIEFSFGGAGH